jgi:hypothetical protein
VIRLAARNEKAITAIRVIIVLTPNEKFDMYVRLLRYDMNDSDGDDIDEIGDRTIIE